jgi:hypothetical protein
LAWFIEIFRTEQVLRDYSDDDRLLNRLNQVLRRVKLSPLPAEAAAFVAASREIVRQRINELLPDQLFDSAHHHH